MQIIKSYSEMCRYNSFEDRLSYLQLCGQVGIETFGFDRYLNQSLYKCSEWRRARNIVIARDNGFDLGCEGYGIKGRILIHHINPITVEDILDGNPYVFDPENLITVSHQTHNAIHYGDESLIIKRPIERKPGDTCLWKTGGFNGFN